MKKIFLIISLLINIVLICFLIYNCNLNCNTKEKKAINDSNVKIALLGNSITHQGNWEEVIGRKGIANLGVPGFTTGQLIWMIKGGLEKYPSSKIWFIEGGINDISLGVPVERIFQNLKEIADSLHRNNIIPVLQSTILKDNAPDDNRKVNELNSMVSMYCSEMNVDYIDLNAFLSENNELRTDFSTDGCHLKPPAYIPWGKEIQKVIKKYNI